MKADLTRNTFNPFKHFTRVLMQQGRVQLDADWNEQAAISLRFLHALAADLIGPAGGPIADLGFQIVGSSTSDFAILPGHYYVDGILCELSYSSAPVPITGIGDQNSQFQVPAASAAQFVQNQRVLLTAANQGIVRTVQKVTSDGIVTVDSDISVVLNQANPLAYPEFISYLSQPDYNGAAKLANGNSLIYLDVWERLITDVEDDSIREVALGGPDTAARSQLVCQVKSLPESTCDTNLKDRFQPANRGLLKVVAKQQTVSTDPCVIAPDASFSGPENQLYRVEVHTGGAYDGATQTFKWSRENGSVAFPIVKLTATTTSTASTTTVVLENLGRDDRFGLNENDWVEVQDDDSVLQGTAGILLQVQSIDSGNLTVTLAGVPSSNVGRTASKHPLLLRWDQSSGDPAQGGLQLGPDNAALIVEGESWLSLEDGIQIQFQPASGSTPNQYRTGDYWLIPARTAIANVEWPTEPNGAIALPLNGVEHHYAPLALVQISEAGIVVNTSCQKVIHPLAVAPVT